MKKRLIVFIFLAFVVVVVYNGNRSEDNFVEKSSVKKENLLSMMIEQTAGAGDYELETRSSWPTDGYIFNETLSRCENGSKLSWNEEVGAVVFSGNVSDKCYVYFDKLPPTLAEYVIAQYTGTQGENNIYYHNGTILDDDGNIIDANDGSYRYAGAYDEVNNFVCFGSDEDICPNDNLYRIIGVFEDNVHGVTDKQLVKLVKFDYANSNLLGTDGFYVGSFTIENNDEYAKRGGALSSIDEYYYSYDESMVEMSLNSTNYKVKRLSSTLSSLWPDSDLNLINLNANYINNIGNVWNTKIASSYWDVNVKEWDVYRTFANEVNKIEIVSLDYNNKIGLMYISDYGYAANPNAWTYKMSYYNGSDDYSSSSAKNVNWLYMGVEEWVITQTGDGTNSYAVPIYITSTGYTQYDYGGWGIFYSIAVRPTFYLNSDVTIIGNHQGTSSDPIRIN